MSDKNAESTAPEVRAANFQRLVDYYRIDPAAEEGSATAPPERFAVAMIESRADTSENHLTTAGSFKDACHLAGEEVLDSGRLPDAVYDLDAGQRIELFTATPVVLRSAEQGTMINPLEQNAGEQEVQES